MSQIQCKANGHRSLAQRIAKSEQLAKMAKNCQGVSLDILGEIERKIVSQLIGPIFTSEVERANGPRPLAQRIVKPKQVAKMTEQCQGVSLGILGEIERDYCKEFCWTSAKNEKTSDWAEIHTKGRQQCADYGNSNRSSLGPIALGAAPRQIWTPSPLFTNGPLV